MTGDYFKGAPLSEVCARMADASGKPLKAICADIGKGYTTLYRELDATDEGAKLGVDTLLPLMRACFSEWPPKTPPAPLLWLASKCGFRCVANKPEPERANILEEIMDDHYALCDFQEAARRRRLPPGQIAEKGRKAQCEIEETVEQYRREYEARRRDNGD